ncbi:PAAR-like domain-containing protein [Serratia microhaemolytica]|uniref:PAAR-like domain-containing protein n=1 Tax=Serratia microhaemolytica TaxID=2675110 RepID=UPI000FDD21A6|nr:PAAR-like domain-containing protein [Serratia microhaemolytica]
MSTQVYINDHEACSKSSRGASNGAFPDPCWSPPSPPAGPVVIPYPNSSKAADMAKGTSTVFIKRGMVAKEDRSYFATSTGNEGATQAFNKGVATGKITGKTYFVKWSQNVKFEGRCVPRDIDLTTHNHGSKPGNSATFPYLSKRAVNKYCKEEKKAIEQNCKTEDEHWTKTHCTDELSITFNSFDKAKDFMKNSLSKFERKFDKLIKSTPKNKNQEDIINKKVRNRVLAKQVKRAASNKCIKSRKCLLVPYSTKTKITPKQESKAEPSTNKGCCPGQTGHHLIPGAMMRPACKNYHHGRAPTVCAEGTTQDSGTHGKLHRAFDQQLFKLFVKKGGNRMISMGETIGAAVRSFQEALPYSNCNMKCIQKQLENYYILNCKESNLEINPITKPGNEMFNAGLAAMPISLEGIAIAITKNNQNHDSGWK